MKVEFITLTLLSGSFAKILSQIVENNDDKVAKYLLKADKAIKNYKAVSSDSKDEQISEIKTLLTDFARQLTLKLDSFEVSFIPKDHIPEYSSSGNWLKTNRQSGKPGKIIQKVIGKGKFSNAEYEQFVYHLKAAWSDKGYEIKLVSGEDIRNWYHEDNYYEIKNTLGNSCMKYDCCQGYFDIYCEQPECQMLIALKEGKLAGRALVWTVDDITFLDRVYYIEDCIYSIFKEYAISNKWVIREDNSLLSDGDDQMFLSPKDDYAKPVLLSFQIKLNRRYDYYPYIDTFRYFDNIANVLYSYNPGISSIVMCSSTEGDYDGNDMICPYCGEEIFRPSDIVYSNWFDSEGCNNCMIWSAIMEDYIYNSSSYQVCLCHGIFDVAVEEWLVSRPSEYVCVSGSWVSTKCEDLYIDENGVYKLTNEEN